VGRYFFRPSEVGKAGYCAGAFVSKSDVASQQVQVRRFQHKCLPPYGSTYRTTVTVAREDLNQVSSTASYKHISAPTKRRYHL
jgi:hypothetical protein